MKTKTIVVLMSAAMLIPVAYAAQDMDMQRMHEQDKKMDNIMQKAEKTSNPNKRMKMMREHMSMMMDMRGMMGGEGKKHDMQDKDMNMKMDDRMDMMQMMMENMMDQQKMMMDMK